MAESDPALNASQDAATANVRVGGIENRIANPDRLAAVEAQLLSYQSIFEERDKAVVRAEAERVLAAQAVKDALDQAKETSSKALEALALTTASALLSALENANKLEETRVAKVGDEVAGVREGTRATFEERKVAQDKFEATVSQEFAKMNEFRKALEDLGKGMATRRELEVSVQSLEASGQERQNQIAALQTAVAVGPIDLPGLHTQYDNLHGEKSAKQQISQSFLAWAGLAVFAGATIFSIVAQELIHLLGG
jgi:phage-related tail fiber protein